MSYGLRFRTVSQSLGTSLDFFVPEADFPVENNARGYNVYRDKLVAPNGNTWLYDKGKTKHWSVSFEDVTTNTKEIMEHICLGWLCKKQVTVVFWGTNVTGTTQSCGTYEAGMIWGTGYLEMTEPKERIADMWSFDVEINEFGTNQVFN
jgi:hypothetical protein